MYLLSIFDKVGKNIQWKRQSLQQVVLGGAGKLHGKSMKSEHSLIPYMKISREWFKYLNIRLDTLKLPEENIDKILFNINCSNILLGQSVKAKETKAKINKCGPIKLISFFTLQETIHKRKRQPMEWEKIFANNVTSKFGKLSSGHKTGKVSFHSNPKERQCQRMLKLPHNCTHLTR